MVDLYSQIAPIFQHNAVRDFPFGPEGVQQADGFAGVHAFFGLVFFKIIQLFNNGFRNHHVILIESKDSPRGL